MAFLLARILKGRGEASSQEEKDGRTRKRVEKLVERD